MRIGILSDIHDQVWNLRAALGALQDVDALYVAGDLCSPFVVPVLAEGFTAGPIHVVFGNNDGDRYRMAEVARAYEHLELHGEAYRARVDGRELAMNHFPELAETMDAQRIGLVVHGHDHRYRVERTPAGWRLDPGTLLGYAPSGRTDVPATFLVYDSAADRVEGYALANERDEPATASPPARVVPYRG